MILLDLLRGRYLGVGAGQARALAEVVTGWPLASRSLRAAEAPATAQDVSGLATRLLAQGVLSDRHCDIPTPASIERPDATLAVEHACATGALITTTRLIRFLKAASSAHLSLRFRSLQSIAIAAANRRPGSAFGSAAGNDALRDAVAVYQRLRPLVFTVRDKCLFDSLALLEFLAAEGMHPHWIIGVRTHPFTAHSWVQSGPLVLNDHHEHVRSYRPILAV